MESFKVVQGVGYFLVMGKECRMFKGIVEDYIYVKDNDFTEGTAWLTNKNDKQLSGLIR